MFLKASDLSNLGLHLLSLFALILEKRLQRSILLIEIDHPLTEFLEVISLLLARDLGDDDLESGKEFGEDFLSLLRRLGIYHWRMFISKGL